jgi:hypothetical protein
MEQNEFNVENNIIEFYGNRFAAIERDGKKYILTNEEAENIYNFVAEQYRIEDAKKQVNTYILEFIDKPEDFDPDTLDKSIFTKDDIARYCSKDDLKTFCKLLSLEHQDLVSMARDYIYEMDCNIDENSLWRNLINKYIKNID